jgi:phage shock protein C
MNPRLTKSKNDKIIEGVCGGLAEYFRIDPVLVRFIFIILIFFDGLGILLYLILVIIMPKADKLEQSPKETILENAQEFGERVKDAGEVFGAAIMKKSEERHRSLWPGIFLILLGVFFLLDNLHMIDWIDKHLLWPIIIILIGVWLLIKRRI